jgi:hypothetical protein
MSTSKRIINPFKVIAAGDMSANITGAETAVTGVDHISMYLEWTGTDPVGTFEVDFLLEPKEKSASGLDVWGIFDLGVTVDITGDSGSHTIVFTEMPYTRIRPRYVFDSGEGSLTVTIVAKEG